MQTAALAASYARTQYRVRLPRGGHTTIRIGEPLPPTLARMLPHADAPWAFVTAWNPRSESLPARANHVRQRELCAMLQRTHATVHIGVGVADDGDWCEPSLFVTGLPFARLDRLMHPFQQRAIVRGQGAGAAELHWLD